MIETTGMNAIFSLFLRFRNSRGNGKEKGRREISTRVDEAEDTGSVRDSEFDLKGIYSNRNLLQAKSALCFSPFVRLSASTRNVEAFFIKRTATSIASR